MVEIKDVKFDERVDCVDSKTTTLYFIAPKEWLKSFTGHDYPEAVSMEVSLEFPFCSIDAVNASVSVSPTMQCDDGCTDYDWTDVDLSVEEIKALINLVPKDEKTYVVYISQSYVRDTQFFCPEHPIEDKSSIDELMDDDDNWDDTNKFGLFVGVYKWPDGDSSLRAYVSSKYDIPEDILVCFPVT